MASIKESKVEIYEDCPDCKEIGKCKYCPIESSSSRLLDECESFYYLYCEIGNRMYLPWNNNQSELNKDNLFLNLERREKEPSLHTPLVVNGAFAVELALKYLILLEQRAFLRGHDLKELHYLIPKEDRAAIETKLCEKGCERSNIEKNLDQMKDAFQEWRYLFEKHAVCISSFFHDYVRTVCEYVLLRKQDVILYKEST